MLKVLEQLLHKIKANRRREMVLQHDRGRAAIKHTTARLMAPAGVPANATTSYEQAHPPPLHCNDSIQCPSSSRSTPFLYPEISADTPIFVGNQGRQTFHSKFNSSAVLLPNLIINTLTTLALRQFSPHICCDRV